MHMGSVQHIGAPPLPPLPGQFVPYEYQSNPTYFMQAGNPMPPPPPGNFTRAYYKKKPL